MITYQTLWFFIVLSMLAIYAALDGFDLGSGVWNLFTRDEEKKKAIIASIAPFWDGNEVWLIAAGTCLFAAFPAVYATVFSGFYLALMLVAFALMFRAVSIEYRNKSESPAWSAFWDLSFSLGSLIPALLYGVAIGNIMGGVPLTAGGEFAGNFFTLLNPYSLLMGVFGLVMFAFHGAVHMKDDRKIKISGIIYVALFALVILATYLFKNELFDNFRAYPLLWALPLISVVCAFYAIKSKALTGSAVSVITNMFMMGAAIFPNIVFSDSATASLSIFNSSSSLLTLKTMAIIAAIGMPFVIGYTIWFYRTFKKVYQVY